MNDPLTTPAQVEVGATLPSISLPLDRTRICQGAAATLDWFGGHHDPAYAESQGIPDIYPNVMFIQGLVDRLVYTWAGPTVMIRRRRIDMLMPLLAGRNAVVEGTVASLGDDGNEITIDATIGTEDGICVRAMVTAGLEPQGDRP